MAATVTAGRTATAAAGGSSPIPASQPPAQLSPAPAAGAAAGSAPAITIFEPPFKSPQTWTYDPDQVTVKVGAKVTWTNGGAVAHTATAEDAKSFDSGIIDPKATFSFTVSPPGTFAYHCTFHPWMKGTLTVRT